jgi:HK97 family phage prohead protease
MPLPTPHAGESQEVFHSRCMGDSTMRSDYPDQKQRNAVCYSQWDEKHGSHPKPKKTVDRAWSTLTVKSVDQETRTIEGIASTPTIDRMGDIVEPMGAEFSLPLPLLFAHQHTSPVGHVVAADADAKGIRFRARIAKISEPGQMKDLVDKAWHAVKAGLMRGISIGFSPKEYEPIRETGGLRFTKYALYEMSLVAIPANADASINLIKSLSNGKSAVASDESEPAVTPTSQPGAAGKPQKPASVRLKPMERKTFTDQIQSLEATRQAKNARMAEIMQKAIDDGRSTDESERDEYDGLEREVEALDGDLTRLRKLEKFNLAAAQPVVAKSIADGTEARGGNGAAGAIRVREPELPPGIRFSRVVRCLGLAQGNRGAAVMIAEQKYPDDTGIQNVLKAAVAAGDTTSTTWAGALVGAETRLLTSRQQLRPRSARAGKGGSSVLGRADAAAGGSPATGMRLL